MGETELLSSEQARRSGIQHRFHPPRLACSSRIARRLARWLVVMLVLMMIGMLFAPWQQNIKGSGKVVAFSPLVRPQSVEVPVSGKITKFAENIHEGMRIKEGEFIAEIRDLDPDYLTRIEQQLAAKKRELEQTNHVATAYADQVSAFETARDEIVAAAEQYVQMAEQKKLAELRSLDAVTAALAQEKLNYQRQQGLERDGLTSTLALQVQERKLKEAESRVEQAKAYIASAENDIEAKRRELSAKEREASTKIDSAQAQWRKASADIAKIDKEILELQSKLAQQQNQTLFAPIDGFVFRVHRFQGGQIVKQGEPLLTIVPDTADRAVEIWLSGNDAPLVTPGRRVRLQFEGWPAIQIGGWPSAAVGSFGGKVAMVDATDNGKGQFRVLVVPDKEDDPWPADADRFLRQGVQANGWILLERVSLGFEVWRQLNAFPPVVDVDETTKKEGGSPLKKLK